MLSINLTILLSILSYIIPSALLICNGIEDHILDSTIGTCGKTIYKCHLGGSPTIYNVADAGYMFSADLKKIPINSNTIKDCGLTLTCAQNGMIVSITKVPNSSHSFVFNNSYCYAKLEDDMYILNSTWSDCSIKRYITTNLSVGFEAGINIVRDGKLTFDSEFKVACLYQEGKEISKSIDVIEIEDDSNNTRVEALIQISNIVIPLNLWNNYPPMVYMGDKVYGRVGLSTNVPSLWISLHSCWITNNENNELFVDNLYTNGCTQEASFMYDHNESVIDFSFKVIPFQGITVSPYSVEVLHLYCSVVTCYDDPNCESKGVCKAQNHFRPDTDPVLKSKLLLLKKNEVVNKKKLITTVPSNITLIMCVLMISTVMTIVLAFLLRLRHPPSDHYPEHVFVGVPLH